MSNYLRDGVDRLGIEGRTTLAQMLVGRFLGESQISSWEDFVRITTEITDLTKEELTDARKFLTQNDANREDQIGETDVPEDRPEDKGDPGEQGDDPEGTGDPDRI